MTFKSKLNETENFNFLKILKQAEPNINTSIKTEFLDQFGQAWSVLVFAPKIEDQEIQQTFWQRGWLIYEIIDYLATAITTAPQTFPI